MIVYVVESGEYSDRCVDFVTDSEEVAKLYCELHVNDSAYYHEYDTEAVSLEELKTEKDKSIPCWKFMFEPTGELISTVFLYIESNNEISSFIDFANCANIYVSNIPKDEKERAIKAARDKRAKLLAEKFGL